MAALTASNTQPGTSPNQIRGYKEANIKVRYYDVTLDTGDYAQTGFVLNASALNPPLKRINFVTVSGGVAMKADKTVAAPIGVTYASDGTSVNLFFFESAGDGDGLDNKPAEANNYTNAFRIKVEGI